MSRVALALLVAAVTPGASNLISKLGELAETASAGVAESSNVLEELDAQLAKIDRVNRACSTAKNQTACYAVGSGLCTWTAAGKCEATKHLYFYWINVAANRCGDVDAALPWLMPKELFEPEHKLQLLLYVQVTVKLYDIPGGPQPGELKLGQCKDHGYPIDGHAIRGALWTPMDLQGPTCRVLCRCQWWDRHQLPNQGYGPAAGLPNCTDVPDDPKAGKFCSLCGPKAPGNCDDQPGACSIGVNIWYKSRMGQQEEQQWV